MIRVTATEFSKEVGRYQDTALTQPVIVTRNGRDRTVVISADEYQRLKQRDRRAVKLEEFSDDEIARIAADRPPAEDAKLDEELKDWKP